jgi:hypothetical protein
MPAREVAEALLTVHAATTARSELAKGKPIRAGELAALVGVTPTRIRQLVKARILKREGLGLNAESCRAWLATNPSGPARRHVLRVEPSWWNDRPFSPRMRLAVQLESILSEFAPAGSSLDTYAGDRVLLRIPKEAGVDEARAEQIRGAIEAWLSVRDPGFAMTPAASMCEGAGEPRADGDGRTAERADGDVRTAERADGDVRTDEGADAARAAGGCARETLAGA